MHIILCHGFGFDHHFWDRFIPYVSNHTYSRMDLGHINTLVTPVFKDDVTIGIGHSLGFLKLCAMEDHFDALIGLNGFLNFLGLSIETRQKRLKEFYAFKKSFIQNPIKTLENFYKRCGADDVIEYPKSYNVTIMTKDLDLLKKDVSPPKIPTLLLSSADDVVVAQEHLYKDENLSIDYIDGACHMMGVKKTHEVYQKVINFLYTQFGYH